MKTKCLLLLLFSSLCVFFLVGANVALAKADGSESFWTFEFDPGSRVFDANGSPGYPDDVFYIQARATGTVSYYFELENHADESWVARGGVWGKEIVNSVGPGESRWEELFSPLYNPYNMERRARVLLYAYSGDNEPEVAASLEIIQEANSFGYSLRP